jgi:hypothetical protein
MLLLEYVPRDRATRASHATAFSASLLDPEQPVPSMVAGPNGKGAVKRYNVYRNNVTVSLIDALAAVYPAVQRITGVEFFRAMARFYIRKTPPQSPLLFEYGREFPTFIEQYEYALPMPWLADTARIERAWLDAYHAADAAPLSPADLASVPPERLAEAIFTPHPTTRIVRSKFAALTIFAANRSEAPVGAIDAGVDSLAKTRRAALARLRPPPRLALSEWIEANVHLPRAQATPGPMRLWNFQISRTVSATQASSAFPS